MPKYDGNLTKVDVSADFLSNLSEMSGLLYSHIRKMVRSVGERNEYNRAKEDARILCESLLEKLK